MQVPFEDSAPTARENGEGAGGILGESPQIMPQVKPQVKDRGEEGRKVEQKHSRVFGKAV